MSKTTQTKRPFGVHYFSRTGKSGKKWYAAIHAKNRTETWRTSEPDGYTRIAGAKKAYASFRALVGATRNLPTFINGVLQPTV